MFRDSHVVLDIGKPDKVRRAFAADDPTNPPRTRVRILMKDARLRRQTDRAAFVGLYPYRLDNW